MVGSLLNPLYKLFLVLKKNTMNGKKFIVTYHQNLLES